MATAITIPEAIELLGQYVAPISDSAIYVKIDAFPSSCGGVPILAVDEGGVTYHHYNSRHHIAWGVVRGIEVSRWPSAMHGQTGDTWTRHYTLADERIAA